MAAGARRYCHRLNRLSPNLPPFDDGGASFASSHLNYKPWVKKLQGSGMKTCIEIM